MGQPEINQMLQALRRQGISSSELKGLSENELRKLCDERLAKSLTGNKNWGNTDEFKKQHEYNAIFTTQKGEKIKVARLAYTVLPSGRKIETFVDIAGNQYFQYRAADNTVLKEDYFRTKEKLTKGEQYRYINGKVCKTDKSGTPIISEKKDVKKPFGSDKKIGFFMQGGVGDCTLLAEMIANSNNPIGKEYIKNAISYNENGDVVVYFMGIDKSITVPKEELYSPLGVLGDTDASAIEKAVWFYIKKRQKENENGAGPDILETYWEETPKRKFADLFKYGISYSEIAGFKEGYLTYMLTGCEESHNIKDDEYKNFYLKYAKSPDKYFAVTSFSDKNKHWYSSIKELFGGLAGKEIVCNHAHGVKECRENEIVFNNPWKSTVDLSYNVEDLKKDYRFCLKVFNTDHFLKKPETTRDAMGGETTVYKRRNGMVARTIEKNNLGQLVRIQTFDTKGNRTGLQEYKNGVKTKYTTFYNYIDEDIKEMKKEGCDEEYISEYLNDFAVSVTYYFEDNKLTKGVFEYANGRIEEKPAEEI